MDPERLTCFALEVTVESVEDAVVVDSLGRRPFTTFATVEDETESGATDVVEDLKPC